MSDTEGNSNINPDDLLKILVATDIHLGYNEKHSLRGTWGIYMNIIYAIFKK